MRSVVYATLYPVMVDLAREYGYALALHGSMVRDLDLIAVPWTCDAASAQELVVAIQGYFNLLFDCSDVDGPELKSHGRLAWSFQLGNGLYVDLSVTPRER